MHAHLGFLTPVVSPDRKERLIKEYHRALKRKSGYNEWYKSLPFEERVAIQEHILSVVASVGDDEDEFGRRGGRGGRGGGRRGGGGHRPWRRGNFRRAHRGFYQPTNVGPDWCLDPWGWPMPCEEMDLLYGAQDDRVGDGGSLSSLDEEMRSTLTSFMMARPWFIKKIQASEPILRDLGKERDHIIITGGNPSAIEAETRSVFVEAINPNNTAKLEAILKPLIKARDTLLRAGARYGDHFGFTAPVAENDRAYEDEDEDGEPIIIGGVHRKRARELQAQLDAYQNLLADPDYAELVADEYAKFMAGLTEDEKALMAKLQARRASKGDEFGFLFMVPVAAASLTATAIRTRRERIAAGERQVRRGHPLSAKLSDHLRRDVHWIRNILPSIQNPRKAARLRTELAQIHRILLAAKRT